VSRIQVMQPLLGEEEAQAAADVIRSGWVAQGPKVVEFERQFTEKVGAEHGIAVTSGTTALHLAMIALGIGPGDEVIVPSLSFIATASCARYVGAEPVFADVSLETGNLTVATINAVRTSRTKAIIGVHQAGVPFDTVAIRAAAKDWDLPLVEDSACAHGTMAHGESVGKGADISTWSFHPRKLLTTGEGGMITTDQPDWAARMRRLREHGMSVSALERHASAQPVLESYVEVGYNFRMTDIQAAVGLVQLGRLDGLIERRRELAANYHTLLADLPVRAVRDPAYGLTNYQSFWVLLEDEFGVARDDVLAELAAAGVSARRGIMAAHVEPPYTDGHHAPLPVTERLTRNTLILPLHHALSEDDQDHVVSVLRKLAKG
jgi:dTDP-4-amino-4,6-dideoxygalactose transaminase